MRPTIGSEPLKEPRREPCKEPLKGAFKGALKKNTHTHIKESLNQGTPREPLKESVQEPLGFRSPCQPLRVNSNKLEKPD